MRNEQVERLKLEVQKLTTENAEQRQRLLSVTQELSSLSFEPHNSTSVSPVAPARNYTVSGMYGYVEAISLDFLTDSQRNRLDSGLRGFLNGGVPLTEPVKLEVWTAFSDRFIKFLEEVGLHVQKNWVDFNYDDTKRTSVSAHKLQALHLYHGYALQDHTSLQWYISSRTMETLRMLCLARGLL